MKIDMRPAKEVARFWSKAREEDRGFSSPCLVWTLHTVSGYGKFHLQRPDNRIVQAHRYSYALEHGEEFLHSTVYDRTHEVDHLCEQTDCVNPAHLEYVTKTVNLQRMHAAAKTEFCSKGLHLRSEYERPRSENPNWTYCIGCYRKVDHRRRERKRVNV